MSLVTRKSSVSMLSKPNSSHHVSTDTIEMTSNVPLLKENLSQLDITGGVLLYEGLSFKKFPNFSPFSGLDMLKETLDNPSSRIGRFSVLHRVILITSSSQSEVLEPIHDFLHETGVPLSCIISLNPDVDLSSIAKRSGGMFVSSSLENILFQQVFFPLFFF